jgi:hypothetical protein
MKPEWTLHVGGTKTGFGADGSPDGVSVSPGALAALATIGLLAITPGKSAGAGANMYKAAAAHFAGGALVYEGVKLAEQQVLPRLEGAMSPSVPAGALPPGTPVTAGMPYGFQANAPYMGITARHYGWRSPNAYTNYEIQSALAQYGAV